MMNIPKAAGNDFDGRFREILSDPINLLIARVPDAGLVKGDQVVLHNGNRVPVSGPAAYYDQFSRILVFNRGVHEPLEEYCFQQVLGHLRPDPLMIELGAYWAHYSMWLKRSFPASQVIMIEPDEVNIAVGKANFEINGFEGEFINRYVDRGDFEIDAFGSERGIDFIDLLHADIQGFEIAMLEGARRTLSDKAVGYVFVSTHSQDLHANATRLLEDSGYRIDVTSDFDFQTTSFDGLIVARRPDLPAVMGPLPALGRQDIAGAPPRDLIENILGHVTGRAISLDDLG